MKIKVAEYIAQFLTNQGVKHMFTVTGGGAMHLNDAFGHQQGLTCIYNHHEQASAIAAEGYARLSGRVAGICVTSGPGGTNAITGVLGGWQDSIPMFIISGQVKRETTTWNTSAALRQLGDQEFQIVDCIKGMTKYAVMVTDPEEIRYHVEKAWYLCQSGRKGPVWLDIPVDVQGMSVEVQDLKGFTPEELDTFEYENPPYDPRLTQKIIDKIKEAKRPVILAGTGIRLADAREEFLTCIELLQIPVLTAWNAHDLLWDTHPLYCGRPGSVGTRGGNFAVQNSDLLIVLGCRLNIRQISYNYKAFAKDAYKIIVDIDKQELQKPTVKPDMPVCADVKEVMRDLTRVMLEIKKAVNFPVHEKWLHYCKTLNEKYPAVRDSFYINKSTLNPYVFIKSLFQELSERDRIICGNGSACVITFQAAEIKKEQRLFTNSGCAAMGYGFPAAIGACIAGGNKRVICIDGDGSFQMNLQELQTAVHHNLNLKIIILNNDGYHSIRQTQNNLFTPPFVGVNAESGISFPSLEKLAYAYDIPYVKIEKLNNISTLIVSMLQSEGPVLCEAVVDSGQSFEPKLSSKAMPDGTMVSAPLDDMFPFLPREEYEKICKECREI